jgi:hypothetical protein
VTLRPGARLLIGLIFCAPACAGTNDPVAAGPATGAIEHYTYRLQPAGRNGRDAHQTATMEFHHSATGSICVSSAQRGDIREVTRITMDRNAEVVAADRSEYDKSGKRLCRVRIWKEGRTVHIERERRGALKHRSKEQPAGTRFGVDMSLLALIRSFPFNTEKEWKVFVADFSRIYVTLTIRHAGTETIAVPAGRIRCHRIRLTVDMPIFSPKVDYWVSAAPPHYLVRHTGRRGPFSPVYTMSLSATNRPAAASQSSGAAADPETPGSHP